MEFLKSVRQIMILVLLMSNGCYCLMAQNQQQIKQAFAESYQLEGEGDFSHAIEKLKSVYNQNSYEINLRLGWLNYQSGVFTESIAHYQCALHLMPYSEEAKFGLILPNAAIGKWQEVIKLYKRILENSPNQTVANYRLGLIYYGQKNYDKAYFHFKKVVDLYPFGYDSLIMLAWTSYHKGNDREAKVLFQKVLLYSPKDTSALEGLKLLSK